MTKIHELWSKKLFGVQNDQQVAGSVMESLKEMIAGHFTKRFPDYVFWKLQEARYHDDDS